jgi:putative tryptophan/tyrosine transport system substrate-binding protein
VIRREFITLFGGAAAAWPHAALAQQAGKTPRIGYLSPGSSTAELARDEAFRQGLRELGYIEGSNILIEYRFAEGKFERLPGLAAELVRLDVDVIVALVTQASIAAKHATKTIPIVMVAVSDPLGSGLVASLSRPGGNVTGTSSMTSEVAGKSLEMLKEVVPTVDRVAVLWNPDNAIFQAQLLREAQLAAGRLGIELRTHAARGPDDLDRAFAAIPAEGAGALFVLADPILAIHRKRIVDFAEKSRLPAMYGIKDYAAVGGLMSYTANMRDQFRRAAAHMDKILKGAKPADIPVEQPTSFELVINLRTAKALGIEVPPTLLARGDEVIE